MCACNFLLGVLHSFSYDEGPPSLPHMLVNLVPTHIYGYINFV